MKTNNFKVNWSNTKRNLSKHSPLIMTGLGVVASVGAVVTAFKVAPKAKSVLEEVNENINPEDKKIKQIWDKTKAVAPLVAPVVLQEAVAIGCIVGSYKVNSKRLVALSTAYTLSETRFDEYRKQVIKNFGERKEQKVHDDIAAEKVKENQEKLSAVQVPDGKVLCLDSVTERIFYSDMETLRKIENKLNKRLIDEMFISLNDFYYELDDANCKPCLAGDELGWNSDKLIDFRFSSQLLEDGRPCMVLEYATAPRADFRKLY